MKYSIRILRIMWGWLLSSRKAVWLLTTCYVSGCPLTFILTENKDWSKEYIGVPPPCNLCIVERNLMILNLPLGKLLTTPTLLMIEVSFTYILGPGTDPRHHWVGMWGKSLVYHMLDFISAVCFQLKLMVWCICLSRLIISLVVCEVKSI